MVFMSVGFGAAQRMVGCRFRDLVRLGRRCGYIPRMSYLTLEVEIDHGKIVAKDSARLPDKGSGLLTILQSDGNGQPSLTPLQALDALQEHLRLDAPQAAAWMNAIRDARR